jgi:hypothetical protein
MMTRSLNRLEGRLFTKGGTLFMVVSADEANNTAQVSYRVNDETQVLDLPFSEAAARVAGGTNLILDNLNSPSSARRILEMKDGWYFASREGDIGPYESREEAGQQLGRYILSMQEIGKTSREDEEPQSTKGAGSH